MKAKELKDILDRVPDDAEVKAVFKCSREPIEKSIKNARAEMTLLPSPGEDFNKVYGRLCLYI